MPHRPLTLYPAHAQQHPAINGGNVAILSADNPRFPAELQGEDALKQELDRLGLDYEPTKGKYGSPERSYIVMNPELPTILDLARRLGQESIAYSENGRHQLHFVNGTNAGMATNPAEKHQFVEQEPQDNYTAVPSPTGDPWGYFTWNIDMDSPMVSSKPTPMTQQQVAPMAKSEGTLAADIRKALEALGELRTRELAKAASTHADAVSRRHAAPRAEYTVGKGRGEPIRKAEPVPGVAVAFGVKVKPQILAALANVKRRQTPALAPVPAARPGPANTQAPVTANMGGRAAAIGLKKSAQAPTDSDAYFHPSEKGSTSKPKPAGSPVQNTYRNVPRDYAKGEPNTGSQVNIQTNPFKKPDWQPLGTAMKSDYDPGSAVSMASGDVSHHQSTHGGPGAKLHAALRAKGMKKSEVDDRERIRRVRDAEQKELESIPLRDPSKGRWPEQSGKVPSIAEERQMGKSESTKVDPLDADMARTKHMCKMCRTEMSPVVAALRAKKGGICLKCEFGGMAKGELKYHNNEPQYGQADNVWRPHPEKPSVATPGSGGAISKNPVGNSTNDGAKSVTFPMKKGEGMPVPAAPKPPQAPGAKPAMAGGLQKGTLESKLGTGSKDHIQAQAPVGTNMPMGKTEIPRQGERVGSPKQPIKALEKVAPPGREEQVKELKGKVKNPWAVSWASYNKTKKVEVPAILHKAIRETIDLRKADIGSLKGGMQQAAHAAAPAPTGIPAAGKVQPRSPAEYDAAAFRPASPGAAGAPVPSGLETDTSKKFNPGFKPTVPTIGKGGPGMAPPPLPTKPSATKSGTPIASIRGIRGAPLSKPRV